MGKTAFIFPGQGAQVCGMGQDFYEHTETGRKIFDQASELLGFSMPELCFEKNDRLDITEYTQAAMVTVSVAMLKVMEERGFRPDVTAGLSLGEYCALAASGVMTPEDAILTVRRRGILMQEAVPAGIGGMSAVLGMNAEAIDQVVDPIDGVQVANYNCPGQIVISGRLEAVAQAAEQLKAAGAKRVLPLNVSGPFHSALLKEAGEIPGKCEDFGSRDPLCGQCDRRICDPGGGGKASAGKTGVFFCKMAAECGADDRRRRGPVRGDRPWKDPDRLCKKDQPGCEGR